MSGSQHQLVKQISTCGDVYSVLVKFATGNAATDAAAPGKVNGNTTLAELVKEIARVATVDEKEVSIQLIANFDKFNNKTDAQTSNNDKSSTDVQFSTNHDDEESFSETSTGDEESFDGTSTDDESTDEPSSDDEPEVQEDDGFEVISADDF